MFIARNNELNFLNEKYKSNKGELIVLYGRRRIGKSETLKEFTKNKEHIYYLAQEIGDKDQLKRFSSILLKQSSPNSKYIETFSSWENAFLFIRDLSNDGEKKIIVLDEFQYMCKENRSIASILQSTWDEVLRNENVMIILCGSSLSFIENEILGEKNPLYGRATGIYKMEEMGFYDAIKFFPNYSIKDKFLSYVILGGVPYYLSMFDPSLSLKENIKKNILSKGSVLYNEVEFSLHQELRETSIYNSILNAIANGATRLNEISTKSLINNASKTSVYLKNLISLGIIKREFSVDTSEGEKSNENRGLYFIKDNFFRFYYYFVLPNISSLEDGDTDGVYKEIEGGLDYYSSLTFERICTEFLKEKQKRGELPFRYEIIGRWYGKTSFKDRKGKIETECDIMAINKKTKNILLGECKAQNSPFSYSDALTLFSKFDEEKTIYKVDYFLFSIKSFDKSVIDMSKERENINLYTLEDVVSLSPSSCN